MQKQMQRLQFGLVLGGVALAMGAGGCVSKDFLAESPGAFGLQASGERFGARSDAVFDSPEAGALAVEVSGEWNLPEYGRRDGNLSLSSGDGPLLATSQWPQPARPDFYAPRTIYLRTSEWWGSQSVTSFREERRESYRRDRYLR